MSIGVGKSYEHDKLHKHVRYTDSCSIEKFVAFIEKAIDLSKMCLDLEIKDDKITQVMIQCIKKHIRRDQVEFFILSGCIEAINKSYPLLMKQVKTTWYDECADLDDESIE